MKLSEYKQKSSTPQGLKNLHVELIAEIKFRMYRLSYNAPAAKKAKHNAFFSKAIEILEKKDNSILYNFFASDFTTDEEFVMYIQQVIKGDF